MTEHHRHRCGLSTPGLNRKQDFHYLCFLMFKKSCSVGRKAEILLLYCESALAVYSVSINIQILNKAKFYTKCCNLTHRRVTAAWCVAPPGVRTTPPATSSPAASTARPSAGTSTSLPCCRRSDRCPCRRGSAHNLWHFTHVFATLRTRLMLLSGL